MKDEIIKIFIDRFGLDESIVEKANIIKDNYISSIDVVTLICELEKKFEISITDNEINEDNLGNLEKIELFVNKKLNK
ncbi:MAG: hypothetical protein CFH30_00316 [Alphaproteobacteria bacterium MarineAlpha8_Bin1]|nr:MAG: hypothetical protein CFH30_00316 [Alphaproteobacteria bacterium MarineAlpha8_Bin1]|tara:strand:+ start:238 stop:471 length:234 start_codon:yes stop_codon:yes gene_type:complete